eukprot:TRINITY_DN6789_c0_g2_i1.p1 TRINITY_DN6789_c0_g2~~TRINITY_DN6789_c0_g2_i1.p1  ORF type:complete len:323 (+),score=18.65 TRINITY_DN6789_c0_g2_i1:89-1057(+)
MWINCDTLGIALTVVTWALLAFTNWVVVRHVLVAWLWTSRPRFNLVPLNDFGLVIFFVYQLLIFLSWFSHMRAATTDPGTISESTAPESFRYPKSCSSCKAWKPPRAHHCKTCRRCIFRMDHHCPWINNCVGFGNQKLFILFLGYTAVSALVTLLLLMGSAIYWLASQKSWSDAAPPGSVSLICSGMVAVECLAAVLFVGDFLQEQLESIQMNSTLVETYQRTHGYRTTFWEHWRGVFGHNWLVWPLPYPSAPPPDYTEAAIPDADHEDTYSDDAYNDHLGIAPDENSEVRHHAPPSGSPHLSRMDTGQVTARTRRPGEEQD